MHAPRYHLVYRTWVHLYHPQSLLSPAQQQSLEIPADENGTIG